ncbi:MAG: polysaccharide biosynthesis tyrosine autokinase [Verrucomicrobiota bacterium]
MSEELPEIKPRRSPGTSNFHAKFQRYRNLFFRYWWVALLTVPVAVAVQYWRVNYTPPQFSSYGQMIVNIKLNQQQGAIGSLYQEELGNFVGTQAAIMQGGTVLTRAKDRVASENQGLAACLVKVDVAVLPKTTIFVLHAVGREPQYTQKFLQACMGEYINLKKEMAAHTSDTTIASMTEQIQKLEPELNRVDEQISAFLSTNDLAILEQSAVMNNYVTVLFQRLAEAQSQFDLLNAMTLDQNLLIEQQNQPSRLRAGSMGELSSSGNVLVNADVASTGPAGGSTIGNDYLSIKQQILLLKSDKERFAEYLKPQHPRMVSLDDNTARMTRILAIYRDQSLEQLEARKSALQLQILNLKKETQRVGKESLELASKRGEYERIKARGGRIQALYDQLLTSLQMLDVNKEISPETVTVYQPASDAIPQPPEWARNLILAALMGLGLAFLILFIVDRTDDRLNSYTELQEFFDEQVLGQIPREGRRRFSVDIPLLQAEDKRTAFVESFRNLRSSLLYLTPGGTSPRILLVTSSVPNDGKSVTAANLALALAMSGSKVLLVDADLRKGLLHTRFGIVADQGLGQVLSEKNQDWRKLTQPTRLPNLRLLPRGKVQKHSTEFFFAADMQNFIKEAASEYDFVILDTPPVMAADDAATLAPRVDGVIFVIRAEQTSARIARASLDLLHQRKAKILGVVFNAVRPGVGDYHYYDRYKDYYSTKG